MSKRYEYTTAFCVTDELETMLNDLGSTGWELKHAHENSAGLLSVVMMREVAPEPSPYLAGIHPGKTIGTNGHEEFLAAQDAQHELTKLMPALSTVWLLRYKGEYDKMLFGVFETCQQAEEAEDIYRSSGKCGGGYFDIEVVTVGELLAHAYASDDKS